MKTMASSPRRKLVLLVILLVFVAVHVALFAEGGTWKTLGLVLLALDAFSGWFLFAAIRESRKLDQQD